MSTKGPRLKDVLEVFNDKLDKINDQMEEVKTFERTVTGTLEKIRNTEIPIDVSEFEELNRRITNEQRSFFAEVSGMMQDKKEEIQNELKGKREKLYRFYLYTGISFLVALGFGFFFIKAQISLNEVRSENEELNSFNTRMFEYLQEEKKIGEYNEWLDKKNQPETQDE